MDFTKLLVDAGYIGWAVATFESVFVIPSLIAVIIRTANTAIEIAKENTSVQAELVERWIIHNEQLTRLATTSDRIADAVSQNRQLIEKAFAQKVP